MVLGRVPFLSALSVAASERVARSAVTRDVEAGDIVFRQGEFGDRFYIVVSGQLEVAVDGKLVRTLGIGDHFGELALLRRIPRTATVTALTEARLVSVERQDFLGALSGRNAVTEAIPSTAHIMPLVQPWNPEPFLRNSQASEETRAAALHTVPLLAGLAAGAILDLVRCAEVIEVTPSTVVVEQDSEPDAYFVIVIGEIRFLVDGEPTGSLSQGDGFGELALLHGTGRTASAVASTAATLLRFPAQAFLEAFGATTDQRKRIS